MKKILLLSLLFINLFLNAQVNEAFPSWMEHLVSGEVETIELHTDLGLLLEREASNDEYQDAYITYNDERKQDFNWELKVKPRGKYRRRICDFPPLKLNFSKKALAANTLASFDKYKLVTHCMDDRILSKEAVIREYLTYQLYQEISPVTFKVHLLRIRYVDTGGKYSSFQRYGFIIESAASLEERLQVEECEDCFVQSPQCIDLTSENRLAVFQYMIGNTDFSIIQRRNLKFFATKGSTSLIPVAYDFDFAALVGTQYALPSRHLGQEKITDRVYLGFAVDDDSMEQTLQLFEAKRTAFLEIIRREKRLSLSARTEMKTYIDDFFVGIEALKEEGKIHRTYAQLRQSTAEVIPDGGNPVYYGVGR